MAGGWACTAALTNTKYSAPPTWTQEYLDFTFTAYTADNVNQFDVMIANEYPTTNTGFMFASNAATSSVYLMRAGAVARDYLHVNNFHGSSDLPVAGDRLRFLVTQGPTAAGGYAGLRLDLYVNDMTTVFQTFNADYGTYPWLETEYGNSGYINAPTGTTISGGQFCYGPVSRWTVGSIGFGGSTGTWTPTRLYPSPSLYPSTSLYPQG